jgi:haloacetate dehalogenase
MLFPNSFTIHDVPLPEVTLRARVGGSGPPLLLLHGHPQTHAMWHRVAPTLAQHFTVVCADLRGYGDSSKPAADDKHAAHSKRAMALDQVRLMQHFGFSQFQVLAHDRGARVAHRLAADHPNTVTRMILLDIAPTLAMYEQTTMAFAQAYWHWFFLIQAAPLPERTIEANPEFYVTQMMGKRFGGLSVFDPAAMAEYVRCAALPGAAQSMCEDYRAAATIDLDHDRADRDAGQKITLPLLVLWGKHGVIQRCFDPLKEWHRVAADVRGHALDCGHYIAEEAPEALLENVSQFLMRQ